MQIKSKSLILLAAGGCLFWIFLVFHQGEDDERDKELAVNSATKRKDLLQLGRAESLERPSAEAFNHQRIDGALVVSHEWLNYFGKITANSSNSFEEVWVELSEDPSRPILKSEFYTVLLSRAINAGKGLEYVEKLQEIYGDGDRSSMIVRSAFENSDLPLSDLTELVKKIDKKGAVIAASKGILSKVRREGDVNLTKMGPLLTLGLRNESLKNQMMGVVGEIATRSIHSEEEIHDILQNLDHLLRSHAESEDFDLLRAGIVEKMARNRPLLFLERSLLDKGLLTDEQVRSAVDAATYGGSFPEVAAKLDDLGSVVDQGYVFWKWAKANPKSLQEWLKVDGGKMSPRVQQSGMLGLISMASPEVENDLSDAREMLTKIDIPEIRERARILIEKKETAALVSKYNDSPQSVLDMFTAQDDHQPSVGSGRAVVSQFLNENVDEAYSWMNENWDNFSAEMQEGLAASAAEEAVKAKDFGAASEWASFIVNEEEKKKLLGQIQAEEVFSRD